MKKLEHLIALEGVDQLFLHVSHHVRGHHPHPNLKITTHPIERLKQFRKITAKVFSVTCGILRGDPKFSGAVRKVTTYPFNDFFYAVASQMPPCLDNAAVCAGT